MSDEPAVTYRPPDLLHWFNLNEPAKNVSQLPAMVPDLPSRVRQTLEKAWQGGKSAVDEINRWQSESASYHVYPDRLEARGLARNKSVKFSLVTGIAALKNDRYRVDYEGGHLTIGPVAHLLAGTLRVPVGWLRNGREVPYHLLVDEIAARAGVDIIAE